MLLGLPPSPRRPPKLYAQTRLAAAGDNLRFFVTGATGFVGGRVARQLLAAGHEVVALARTPSKGRELAALGATVREGDVTDKGSMRGPMTGVDGVFHVAGWYKIGVRDKTPAERVNVDGTRNVLQLMEELAIPKGVYTSTLAVFSDTRGRTVDETYRHDGPWLSEYDRTKWVAHYEVAEPFMKRGLPLVIVQPGVNYGPGDEGPLHPVIVRYVRGKLRTLPKGSAYCWTHVDDTARGHLLAMERGDPGEAFIIAGPAHTLIEAFHIAERITGIKAPRFHVSPRFMKFMAALTRSETLRVGAGATYLGNNAKARTTLGFDPRPLEEGFRETLLHEMRVLGIRPAG